ncbi:hypothetical protein CH333_03645 [candidate division WOR-3 bacterium JGI_Cruoil_03_44_89]|uniref:PhoU domain-containing protein n=1 Tax=candidate division WOR-3 bacterium JGI_Cruoil_03_44_89 TaxID=1973748 RepID=A0A235BVW7_UNCW3|nr:MAG: hypothetical protein CH333_03645 [candidate division WOR-3 bacterium JGI_Cruoil_03_44_89]
MNVFLCILILSGLPHLTKAKDPRGSDISGDGMVVTTGRQLPNPVIIEVVDDDGKPVKGIPVDVRFISTPPGTEEKYVSTVLTDTTDVRGYAVFRFYAGNVEGEYWLEASSPVLENRVRLSFISMKPHFIFFLIIGLLGGFALFMYGLNFGSKALTRVAGGKLRELLWKLTKNPIRGLLVGVFITVLTQSSSATTVMLVSFAEAGLVNFIQTLGVILGADVGTTLTVQLIAFKVFEVALIIIAIGFFMMIFGKHKQIHYTGRVIFAFGLIFFGMKVMTDAVYPLTLIPGVTGRLIAMGERPFLLLILSAVFTGMVHSSGATMAIVISFAFSGLIDIGGAIPIIFGANIGTCVTALLASIGRGVEAKRVAMAHIMFKILMVIAFFPFIHQFATLVGYTSASLPRQVANAHTLFNLFAALLFLPFLLPYSKLIARMLPPRKIGFEPRYLDPTFLSSPAIATGQALRETLRMSDIVQSMLAASFNVFKTNEELERLKVIGDDDKVDALEENITLYLVHLSESEMPLDLSKKCAALLHIVDEFEHIGDVISKSLVVYAKKKIKSGFLFSKEGFSEIKGFFNYSGETLRMAIDALATFDNGLAIKVAERREEGRALLSKYHDAHLNRLRKGFKESVETSTVHLDLISDLERINSHASNIGEHILQVK